MRAEAPPCGGSQNSLRWLRPENICATGRPRRTKSRCRYLCRTKTVSRQQPARLCELQKAIFEKRLQTTQFCELQNRQKPAVKQPHANNYSLSILPRHYAASGLLNLLTTLTRALTLVTPGGVADRPDAPGHLRGSKRKPLPEIDRAAVFGFCLRPNSQSALISCSTLLVLRTASAEAANLAASSFVRSIFTIFSIPLRPMIAGTPMQMSSWPYSPSR